jgi:hypothetical protein
MHVIPAHELCTVLFYCSALVSQDHEYATIHTVPWRLNPVDDTLELINRYVTILFLLRCRIIFTVIQFFDNGYLNSFAVLLG